MKRICAIISGGEFSPLEGIDRAEYVIACDKGYEYAVKSGIKPDLILGDFDSCEMELPENVIVEKLPKEKDDTDTMAAIHRALGMGFEHILMYCALGGRLDHLLGNIQAASFAASSSAFVEIIDMDNRLYFMQNTSVEIEPRSGWSLSLLALTDECENVTVRGTKYTLENASLINRYPLGISNEWDGSAHICVGRGILLVILSRK